MRNTAALLEAHKISLGTRVRRTIQSAVRKYVPDPRDNPITEMGGDYESLKGKHATDGDGLLMTGMKPGQSIEDYMAERDRKWLANQKRDFVDPLVKEHGVKTLSDGHLFLSSGKDRSGYNTIDEASKNLKPIDPKDYELTEEKILMRRQLQMESEAEYRKYIAEAKRNEMTQKDMEKQRRPNASDPSYDPFKITPSYRPQDSVFLANWLKKQRESGESASGKPLNTKEGQERFYNEEKMATQFHSNPFAARIETPRGNPKMMITAYSPDSFFLNDKEVIGSIIVTPNRYYHWNVTSVEEVNERTLAVLLHMFPVPDVVFLGTGRNLHFVDEELRIAFQKRGSILHCLTTPNAIGAFGQQLTLTRRVACALINPVNTNAYGRECFGDFIDNDMFSSSDTMLGIMPHKQFNTSMYKTNKIAEKYRETQGTGIGPQYHILSDGRMVRPGTSGTKLRPMLEPGENVEWEKLPSYYHWYPKEHLNDYIENTTWRELKGKATGDPLENRLRKQFTGEKFEKEDEVVDDLAPWDSNSIPLAKWAHERKEDEIIVEDKKTGRIIGMKRPTYEKWRVMMKERAEGKEPSDPVEFDQETIVTGKDGRVFDTSKMRYRPIFEGRWHPRRQQSTGRNTPNMV